MNNILMLWPDKKEDIPSIISQYYSDIVKIDNLYKPTNIYMRFIRKLLSIFGLSTKFFFSEWFKCVNDYNIVIIHANAINRTVPQALRKSGYNGRIIYWYWNPVKSTVHPDKINREYCELWSFDYDDCIKYKLKYNTTYYFKKLVQKNTSTDIDVFFVGKDKHRYEKLILLKNKIDAMGLRTDFRIIKDSTSNSQKKEYSNPIPYSEVINKIQKSNCILEILQTNQSGMSLRVMEALFFNKKLITNNIRLLDNHKYDTSNTYFLGYSKEDLGTFIKKRPLKMSDELLVYYDFKTWLNRFSKEGDED